MALTVRISVLLIVILSCNYQQKATMQHSQHISIYPDIRLWVETYGDPKDEACILISGAGANSSFWSNNLCSRLVDSGFYVIKYDHRDIGFSTKINWEKDPYEFMALTQDAITILDSLNVNKAHIVGHSMGGFIVQLMAIHFPERIISMTSISSSNNSPEIPDPPPETWEIFMANSPQNKLENDLEDFLKVWKYLNGTARFDKELAIEYTKNLYARQDVDGPLGASHVKAQQTLYDRSEELKNVKIPALVMHGEEDYLVDKQGAIFTAKCIENVKLIIIPKMGHIPFNIDILRRFENEICIFLTDNKINK